MGGGVTCICEHSLHHLFLATVQKVLEQQQHVKYTGINEKQLATTQQKDSPFLMLQTKTAVRL